MSDLNLKSFSPLYPMRIHQYDEMFNDQNQNVMDKINSIIDYLNQVGKLTNDVVKDWNTVYQWVMNDGLTTDVNNKLEDMLAKGELNSIIDFLVSKVGDLTTLTTTDKTTIVNAINSLKNELTSSIGLKADQSALDATNANVASNAAQLAERATSVKSFGAVGDGTTDDTTAIQNAYNSLTNGGTLFFPIGNYKITQTLHLNKSNVDFVGIGSSSVIQILSNQLADGTRFQIENCSNVILRDLKFSEVNPVLGRYNVYGTISLNAVNHIYMENIEVDGANGVGIHGINAQDVVLFKPYIHNTKADGIHFQRGSKNIKIVSPEVHENEDDSLAFVSHGYEEYGQCDGFEVYGGNLGYNAVTGSGICCDGSKNIKIRDVKINNTLLAGIRITALTDQGAVTTSYPQNVDITGGTIDTTGLTTGAGEVAGVAVIMANNVKIKDMVLRNAKGGIVTTGCNGLIDIDNIQSYNCNGRFIWVSTQTIGSNNYAIVKVKNGMSKINAGDGIYIDGTLLKIDYVSIEGNDMFDINSTNLGSIFGIFVNNAAKLFTHQNKAYSQNSIQKMGYPSVDFVSRVNNHPLDEFEQIFIGTAPHNRAGEAPTSGTHNLGEFVWNWNPSSGVLGWVCTTTGTPGTWSAVNIN
jgi:polygalacturonase